MKNIKRIILFRFHKDFAVCKNHLEIIRAFNPNMSIYGLYGGSEKDFAQAKKLGLKHVFMIPFEDWYWKWKNGDLCIRWWFKEYGKRLKFDMLHTFEWDMILFDSIEHHFRHVRNGVAITGKKPLKRIYDTWDWTAPKLGRDEFLRLKSRMKKRYQYNKQPLSGIFGGTCLSRTFLERFARSEVESLCNDEVRIPMHAQAFNMPVYDTGLRNKYFGFDDAVLTEEEVYTQCRKGITSFHPVKYKLNIKTILSIKKKS